MQRSYSDSAVESQLKTSNFDTENKYRRRPIHRLPGIVSEVKVLTNSVVELNSKVEKLSSDFQQLDSRVTRNEVEILLLQKKLSDTAKKAKANKTRKQMESKIDYSTLHSADERPAWHALRKIPRHVRVSVSEGSQTETDLGGFQQRLELDPLKQLLDSCKKKKPEPLVFDVETFKQTGRLVSSTVDKNRMCLNDWAYSLMFIHFHVTFLMSFFLD